jgi:hypothetical protein
MIWRPTPREQLVSQLQLCMAGTPALNSPRTPIILGGLTSLFFLLPMAQHGPPGENALPGMSHPTPRQAFLFGLHNVTRTVGRIGAWHTHPPLRHRENHMSSRKCPNQAPVSSRPSTTKSSLTHGMSTKYVISAFSFFQVVNISVEKS